MAIPAGEELQKTRGWYVLHFVIFFFFHVYFELEHFEVLVGDRSVSEETAFSFHCIIM